MADIELVDALPLVGVYPVLPAVTVTTSGTPTDYDGTPAVVGVTSGGTAGDESIVVALPDLPVDGWFNPYLIGQRVIFCLVTQTNASDRVIVTVDGVTDTLFYPSNLAQGWSGITDGIVLDYVGASVCLVWCGDSWRIDYALTGSNFSGTQKYGTALLTTTGQAAVVGGNRIETQTADGASGDDPGGDLVFQFGSGSGAGRQGTIKTGGASGNPLPTSATGLTSGMWWNNAGVINIVP
jgi:hypothetical protein